MAICTALTPELWETETGGLLRYWLVFQLHIQQETLSQEIRQCDRAGHRHPLLASVHVCIGVLTHTQMDSYTTHIHKHIYP